MARPERAAHRKIKKACDDLPQNQRLMVVTVLLSAFVLTAFFVFGNACYKMGARQAQQSIKIEHIESIPLPNKVEMMYEEDVASKMKAYEEMEFESDSETDVEPLDSVPYETAR